MSGDSRIGRAFLVGCPRSGTTLLQSLLAANPAIHSFPESHAFTWLAWLNPWQLDATIREFLRDARLEELTAELPAPSDEVDYPALFIGLLDRATTASGARLWIEKTPIHLHHLDEIRASVPDAKLVHLLRDGRETISSLYVATQSYPDGWGGRRSIEACARRWMEDVRRSLRYVNTDGHVHVRYWSIRAAPEATLHLLCDFLEVAYVPEMLDSHQDVAGSVVLADEPWKDPARSALRRGTPDTGQETRFDELAGESLRGEVAVLQAELDRHVPIDTGNFR